MNRFGVAAQRHWAAHAVARVAEIPDPSRFFTDLGETVQAMVSDLCRTLARPDPAGETFADKLARVGSARRQAEEIVMQQLVWVAAPELPLAEAREEWDQTRASDSFLAVWAYRMQDSPYPVMATDEIEEMETAWALPPGFLQSLIEAESPQAYLDEHQAVLDEAATLRFLTEIR